jgi:hypothetical protein
LSWSFSSSASVLDFMENDYVEKWRDAMGCSPYRAARCGAEECGWASPDFRQNCKLLLL